MEQIDGLLRFRVDTAEARETVLPPLVLLLIEKKLIGWLESTPPSHEDV